MGELDKHEIRAGLQLPSVTGIDAMGANASPELDDWFL